MKKQKGITLIALIITIVVLLILASVAISTVQESRLIEQANYAVQRHKMEEIEEKIRLQKSEMEIAKHVTNQEGEVTVKEVLEKNGENTDETVKIASGATSIPENMPEGEYYILTPEKYASNNKDIRRYAKVTSRGEITENNELKDIYVINENLELYYVIEGEKVKQPKILTLTSDTDSIFTTEFQNLFSGNYSSTPKNVAKLTYKFENDKLQILSNCHDSMGFTCLINVSYYKNEKLISKYTLRGPSRHYFNDDGTVTEGSGYACQGYAHYLKGWNDLNNIKGKCTCTYYPGQNIYGRLTEFPEFLGIWEIDAENSNDYGIQYLQGILVEK